MTGTHNTETRQTAIYTESGWVAEVEILEDRSDAEKHSYTLKVIRTQKAGILGSLPDGHTFKAFADKRYMAYCDWRLYKDAR